MEYRLLGRSGLKVSTLSFGAMTFGGAGMHSSVGNTNVEEARRQIDMCLDAGINLFDTAEAYSQGQSEQILGEALGSRRQDVLVATKCFGRSGAGLGDCGASRHHIIKACEASLRRLNTDYVDLYQIHHQDLNTPPEETLRALDDLVRAGKVRYIGSSNHSGWIQMRALATSDRLGLNRYLSQQIQYSLLQRDAENELLLLGAHEGVGALIWGGLASGYLSGKFVQAASGAEPTRLGGGAQLARIDTTQARSIIDTLNQIAADHHGASASQVAINWIVRKPGVSSVIIGARTAAQLADNLACATWSLNDAEIARLDEVSAPVLPYPYSLHRGMFAAYNPAPPLQLRPPGAG
jgi:aryl-alcohol dehydrogenase-like predicted oxidoreductase